MDAVEFLKGRTRMCNYYMNICRNCPGNEVEYCATLCAAAIDLVPIVERWAEEHPAKTRQSEFLKMFPGAEMTDGVYINICPARISGKYRGDDGICCMAGMGCDECKRDFWLKEIE